MKGSQRLGASGWIPGFRCFGQGAGLEIFCTARCIASRQTWLAALHVSVSSAGQSLHSFLHPIYMATVSISNLARTSGGRVHLHSAPLKLRRGSGSVRVHLRIQRLTLTF